MIAGARIIFLLFLVSCPAWAQVMSVPSSAFGSIGTVTNGPGGSTGLGLLSPELMTNDLWAITSAAQNSTLESPSGSVSKLDLKAPGKSRQEYEKGYQLLGRKDYQNAVPHLANAISIYPNFVAAHNALGTAYLKLGQNDQARQEFEHAVSLDDHLPNSYLNLGCAHLALKSYPAAEASMQKASSIAPLDLQLSTALAYGQFMNHDYPAVVATAQQVHGRKHKGAAIVHLFAAGALDAQGNLADEQHELDALIQEEPTSAAAEQARQILQEIQQEQARQAEAKLHPAQAGTFSFNGPNAVPEGASPQARKILQDLEAKKQIAQAEAEAELDALIQKEPTSAAVSTRDNQEEDSSALLGDHSLQTLAELTGGAAFMPGSIHRLNGSLADLQQVLRGRYLVSYKPAQFERDGRYRSIDITAQKEGHKLRVYARKGYYASVNSLAPDHE